MAPMTLFWHISMPNDKRMSFKISAPNYPWGHKNPKTDICMT